MDEELKGFLREANGVDNSVRPCKFVNHFKMRRLDDSTRNLILTSKAVIPGETHYDCLQCATCCINGEIKLPERLAEKGKPCKFLVENLCSQDVTKPSLCKQFPFKKFVLRYIDGRPDIDLLLISIHCPGQTMGRIITEERCKRLLEEIDKGPENVGQTRDL